MDMASYMKSKTKIYEDLDHSKFEIIIFYIKYIVKNFFKDRDSSNFTEGLDNFE